MNIGLREWWSSLSGGDKLVWVIVVIGFVLYFSGALGDFPTDHAVR